MVPCNTSGVLIADGVVVDKPCLLHGIIVSTATTGVGTAILYDHASAASGTKLTAINVQAGTTAVTQGEHFTNPVICNKGIYLDIGGTNAEVFVYYSLLG
jgi:hypothetical protein